MTAPNDGWDGAYLRDVAAPWDIGRPQPVFVALADRGVLTGSLLDAGCGTGEHALLAAAGGADVLGVDLSAVAIARARAKAAEIYDTTLRIFRLAGEEGVPPAVAADRLAERRMSEIVRLRRFWLGAR